MVVSDAAVEGVSGAIGGIIATVATYPLMTVTTRQATRVKGRAQAGNGTPQKQPSTLHELAELARSGGLFSGLSAALMGTTVSQGIYFYLYSLLRQLAVARKVPRGADARSADITVAQSLAVAALAGMGNVLLTNPIWMVATRMQAQRRAQQSRAGDAGDEEQPALELPPPSALGVAREVYGEYGLGGFWNGCGASLVMVVNPTLQYAFYEWLLRARARVRAARGGGVARASAAEVFLLSALAKMGATVLTYPLLTIKTRMMSARKGDTDMQYSSIGDAAVQILQREGPLGYFKGIRAKLVQSVLAAALLFSAKEKITDMTRDMLLASQPPKLATS